MMPVFNALFKALDDLRGFPLAKTEADEKIDSLYAREESLREIRDALEERYEKRLEKLNSEIEALNDERCALEDARSDAWIAKRQVSA